MEIKDCVLENLVSSGGKTPQNTLIGELKKGIVYVIKCNITNKCYYGSTTQSLNSRKYHHINNNSTVSKDIIDGGDWCMKTLEEIFYKDRSELLIRERWYIEQARKQEEDVDNAPCCINKVLPYITRQEAKEQHEEIMRKWYIKNKRKHLITCTKYQETHKEQHKEAMKRYQQSHREQIKLYQRSYRQKQFDEALRKINDLKLIVL